MSAAPSERPLWEVADVIRAHGAAFLARHGGWLTAGQRRTLRDLANCRTAALGGHREQCLDCGHERIAYNSCRNRHCPKCQALSRARWLAREVDCLLPVAYFHVVFTLPQEVAELALVNPRVLYGALFEATAATLREVAANPKRLGACVGTLLVLHTWGQNLAHHPHVHGIVTGGGLSCNAQGVVDACPRWVSCRPGFFLPVRVLSRVFRGKYLDLLHQAFVDGALVWPRRLTAVQPADAFIAWLAALRTREWVVYAKPPFGGPEQVLKYLARYTHRVAISNSRLLSLDNGGVTFHYKDYADQHHWKTLTLSGEEFLRRFVQHVLPKGFVKLRHYGLLASRQRVQRLAQCRALLLVATLGVVLRLGKGVVEDSAAASVCPHCGSRRLAVRPLPRQESTTAAKDTS